MASREDLAAAAGDPRLPPPRYFAALGILVAVGVGLARVHVLLIAVAPLGMLAGALAGQRAGYVVKDRKSVIALNAPLPGTMGPIWAVMLLVVVASNIVLRVPAEALPAWAVIVVAVIVGAGVALLLRRAELHRMVAIRGLEKAGKFSDGT